MIPLSPVIDARNYSVCEVLPSGLQVCFRALHPDDLSRVEQAFRKLEPDSIQMRFFGAKSELTEADRRIIQETDFESRVNLVAAVTEGAEETIIASSSYSRIDQASAEVAFIVEEDYHGQGIASRLLQHLGLIAREKGIDRFEAEVLPSNSAMLRVFTGSGLPMIARHEDGVVRVSLELRPESSLDAASR